MHRLGSHLPNTLTGDQAQTFRIFRNLLCDAHHVPAHDDRQFIVRAFVIDIQLDVREINDMQIDRPRISSHLRCQIHHLLFRTLAGIRRCMEIYRINLNAPLRDHPARHRGIDTAGQKQHGLTACAHRHSSRSRDDLGININLIAYLHIQKDVRLMHVHMHFRICIQNHASQFHVDLHGIKRIILPGASGRHLEALILIRIHRIDIVDNRFPKLVEAFIFHIDHRTDARYAEHFLQVSHRLVIIKSRHRVHIDTPVCFTHAKLALTLLQSILDLLHQRIFEQIPVLSLHPDLSILDQKSCKHISLLYLPVIFPAPTSAGDKYRLLLPDITQLY